VSPPERETVLLLPGLWNPSWTVRLLARRLASRGFRPMCYRWDTTGATFEESARTLHGFVSRIGAEPLHLVGHSLGGLLVRALLHYHHGEVPAGRVVTLGSPHGGCRTARRAVSYGPLRRLTGRAVDELASGVPSEWRLPEREVGTVSGTIGLGLGRVFPGLEQPNDGVVTEEESRLPGAASRSVRVCHTQLLASSRVARLVAGFLADGAFPQ